MPVQARIADSTAGTKNEAHMLTWRYKHSHNGAIHVENRKERMQQCRALDDEMHYYKVFLLLTETVMFYILLYLWQVLKCHPHT